MYKRFLVLIALLMLGFFVAGCADGSKSSEVTNPNPDVFSPVGSISGLVYDYCTEAPVKGAVVSVAYNGKVHSVTTSTNGVYSFSNVPATGSLMAGGVDRYAVSCDLTKVTGYGYAMVGYTSVMYTSLHDGLNESLGENGYGGDVTEAGSGASTPVDNLAATLDFDPGPLTSGISGTIYDVSTGRAVSGATVSLYDGDIYRAAVTSTDGTYSFATLRPGDDYKLLVTKANYEYAALQASNTVTVPANTCNLVDVACTVGCGMVKAGVNVNMIANPAKDKTIPYIVSLAVGTETDVIDGDKFPSMEYDDVTRIVATFSEGMQASRSLKTNAVNLTSSFAVTVTSSGWTTASAANTTDTVNVNIIDATDYTVTMTSAGVMTVTPAFASSTALKALVAAGGDLTGITSVANMAAATVTIGSGSYTLTLTPGSAHLTDLSPSFNSWTIGNPGALDALGFLHGFGEAYQDYFILGGTPPLPAGASYNIQIYIGD